MQFSLKDVFSSLKYNPHYWQIFVIIFSCLFISMFKEYVITKTEKKENIFSETFITASASLLAFMALNEIVIAVVIGYSGGLYVLKKYFSSIKDLEEDETKDEDTKEKSNNLVTSLPEILLEYKMITKKQYNRIICNEALKDTNDKTTLEDYLLRLPALTKDEIYIAKTILELRKSGRNPTFEEIQEIINERMDNRHEEEN